MHRIPNQQNTMTMEDAIHLPLKGKYYHMIKSGQKKEEYREETPYWMKRICGCPATRCRDTKPDTCQGCPVLEDARKPLSIPKRFSAAHFTLGYPKRDDTERNLLVRIYKVTLGRGNPAWGAEPGKEYIIIHLDKTIKP